MFIRTFIRKMTILLAVGLAVGFLAGCGSAGGSGSSDAGAGGGGGGGGGGGTPPSLSVSSIKIAGTTNVAATVTINGQADQNAAGSAWAYTSTPSLSTLANGYEQTVVATTADGSATKIVTLTVGN